MELTILAERTAMRHAPAIAAVLSQRHSISIVTDDDSRLGCQGVQVRVLGAEPSVSLLAGAAPSRTCLLLDRKTTAREALALLELWSAHASAGGQYPPIELVDRSGAPEDPGVAPSLVVGTTGLRVRVGTLAPSCEGSLWFSDRCEALLPAPLIAPTALLRQGWPDISDSHAQWIDHFARVDATIRLHATDLRPVSREALSSDIARLAYIRLMRRGCKPVSWSEINRQLIPAAESRLARMPFASEKEHVVVVGAQRSGTTWMTECLGGLEDALSLTEDMAVDMLLDGSPQPRVSASLLAWHCAFLSHCPNLLAAAWRDADIIVMVRRPEDIVWSLLYHFGGLGDVASLIGAVHGGKAPEGRVEQAIELVRVAWENIISLYQFKKQRIRFVEYESLTTNPNKQMQRIARWLGRRIVATPNIDTRAILRRRRLTPPALATIDHELRNLHQRLRRLAKAT